MLTARAATADLALALGATLPAIGCFVCGTLTVRRHTRISGLSQRVTSAKAFLCEKAPVRQSVQGSTMLLELRTEKAEHLAGTSHESAKYRQQ